MISGANIRKVKCANMILLQQYIMKVSWRKQAETTGKKMVEEDQKEWQPFPDIYGIVFPTT